MSTPSTTSVETVLFDLDGTLLTYDQDTAEVMAETFEHAGVTPFCEVDELWSATDDVPDVESDHAFLTHLWRIVAERHGGPEDPETHEALARGHETAVDHSQVSLRPGAEAALEAAATHRVGMVTNGSRRTQTVKLDALDLHDRFETVVYAGEDTAPKPDPEPFDLALERLDASPASSLYVGNSLKHDVAGAQAAGLKAAWHPGPFDPTDPGEHTPEFHLETLSELGDVL